MALRLHLTPQAVNTLSRCSAPVREQVQYELGGLVALPVARPVASGASTVVLRSGFRVRYQLDAAQGLLHLLDLREPAPPRA